MWCLLLLLFLSQGGEAVRAALLPHLEPRRATVVSDYHQQRAQQALHAYMNDAVPTAQAMNAWRCAQAAAAVRFSIPVVVFVGEAALRLMLVFGRGPCVLIA